MVFFNTLFFNDIGLIECSAGAEREIYKSLSRLYNSYKLLPIERLLSWRLLLYCREFRQELEPGAEFCMGCGCRPLRGECFCHVCGAETDPGQKNCVDCGEILSKVSARNYAGFWQRLVLQDMAAGILVVVKENNTQVIGYFSRNLFVILY